MATGVPSGIGAYVVVSPQAAYGGAPSFVSARTLGTFKSFEPTHRQHSVQGGPYLRNGQIFDTGPARVLTWLDAMASLKGDMANTGAGLLLACALGTSATLTQLGTTAAYELGGATGTSAGAPDVNGNFLDLQYGAPEAASAAGGGTIIPWTYHSGMITKAEWVFERGALVTYAYDLDFQYPENTTVGATVSEPGGPVPFTMVQNTGGTGSTIKLGTLGTEAAVDGIKKATVTLERKLKTDGREYIGNQYKDMPATNDVALLTVVLDFDYTSQAKTAVSDLQLAGTPTSIVISSIGNVIGTSGHNDTFQLNPTNCFLDTGGEPKASGPDLIGNSATFKATIDATGDAALKAVLITADTGW